MEPGKNRVEWLCPDPAPLVLFPPHPPALETIRQASAGAQQEELARATARVKELEIRLESVEQAAAAARSELAAAKARFIANSAWEVLMGRGGGGPVG